MANCNQVVQQGRVLRSVQKETRCQKNISQMGNGRAYTVEAVKTREELSKLGSYLECDGVGARKKKGRQLVSLEVWQNEDGRALHGQTQTDRPSDAGRKYRIVPTAGR